MRGIIILVFAASWLANAACPTSGGYTNTCFVSLTGSDSSGNGTISAPYKGVVKAVTVMTGGDTLILRGGRYTTQVEISGANWGSVACTAQQPCTVRAMQGEAVIIDGRGWSTSGVLFSTPVGGYTQNPPYADDPKSGHWRFVGIRVEEMPRFVFWMQSQNDDVHFKGIRIHGTSGIRMSSCDGCKVHGVHIDVANLGVADAANGPAIDCTPVQPTNAQAPWPSLAYAASGKGANSPSEYQLRNIAPRFPATESYGCRNFQMMDSFLRKELSSATDLFGIEYGRNVLIERVSFNAPWAYNSELNYGGTTGGTDAFDMKVTGITIKDVQSRGGKSTMKLWGKVERVQGALVIGAEDAGESAVSLAGTMSTGPSVFPSNQTFVPVRYAGNMPNGDAYIVIGGGPFGNVPSDGSHIEIEDVPGCTSINKHVRVKSSIEHKHVIFVLENTDGSPLACNAPYDFTNQNTRTDDRTATFTGGGSPNITLSSDLSWSGYANYMNSCVTFTTTGTLPAGLLSNTCYYVKSKSGTLITVATTPQAGTGGTAAMTFTTGGTGTHTATLREDYMSYAGGKMRTPSTQEGRSTWGVNMSHVTSISSRGTALNGCINCTSPDYSTRKFIYSIHNSVFASPRLTTVTAPVASLGGPRIILSGSTVHLAYHDATAMAVGAQVFFRTTGTLPSSLQANKGYYIVSSDGASRTVQVALTPGGAPLSFSGGNGRYWLQTEGLSTGYVEISTNIGVAAGNTVQFRSATSDGDLPHPFQIGVDYTVDSVTTVSVNGTNVYLAQLSREGSPVSHQSAGTGTWKLYRTGVANNSGSRNFDIGGYSERSGSSNNQYHVGGTITSAYCAKVEGDPGFNVSSNCVSSAAEVGTLEPNSVIEDPALDWTTGRATVATPVSARSKGYYSAFHEVVSATATAAQVRNKFPLAVGQEAAAAVVDDNSDFSSPVESLILNQGGRQQDVVFGKTTPLAANSTYYYRLSQGYDVVTGSFTTAPSDAGTGVVTVKLASPTGVSSSSAVVETSIDGSSWVSEPAVACATGCSVSLGRSKGVYWLRHRYLDSGGATLLMSKEEPRTVR